jgi:hypothetical protein
MNFFLCFINNNVLMQHFDPKNASTWGVYDDNYDSTPTHEQRVAESFLAQSNRALDNLLESLRRAGGGAGAAAIVRDAREAFNRAHAAGFRIRKRLMPQVQRAHATLTEIEEIASAPRAMAIAGASKANAAAQAQAEAAKADAAAATAAEKAAAEKAAAEKAAAVKAQADAAQADAEAAAQAQADAAKAQADAAQAQADAAKAQADAAAKAKADAAKADAAAKAQADAAAKAKADAAKADAAAKAQADAAQADAEAAAKAQADAAKAKADAAKADAAAKVQADAAQADAEAAAKAQADAEAAAKAQADAAAKAKADAAKADAAAKAQADAAKAQADAAAKAKADAAKADAAAKAQADAAQADAEAAAKAQADAAKAQADAAAKAKADAAKADAAAKAQADAAKAHADAAKAQADAAAQAQADAEAAAQADAEAAAQAQAAAAQAKADAERAAKADAEAAWWRGAHNAGYWNLTSAMRAATAIIPTPSGVEVAGLLAPPPTSAEARAAADAQATAERAAEEAAAAQAVATAAAEKAAAELAAAEVAAAERAAAEREAMEATAHTATALAAARADAKSWKDAHGVATRRLQEANEREVVTGLAGLLAPPPSDEATVEAARQQVAADFARLHEAENTAAEWAAAHATAKAQAVAAHTQAAIARTKAEAAQAAARRAFEADLAKIQQADAAATAWEAASRKAEAERRAAEKAAEEAARRKATEEADAESARLAAEADKAQADWLALIAAQREQSYLVATEEDEAERVAAAEADKAQAEWLALLADEQEAAARVAADEDEAERVATEQARIASERVAEAARVEEAAARKAAEEVAHAAAALAAARADAKAWTDSHETATQHLREATEIVSGSVGLLALPPPDEATREAARRLVADVVKMREADKIAAAWAAKHAVALADAARIAAERISRLAALQKAEAARIAAEQKAEAARIAAAEEAAQVAAAEEAHAAKVAADKARIASERQAALAAKKAELKLRMDKAERAAIEEVQAKRVALAAARAGAAQAAAISATQKAALADKARIAADQQAEAQRLREATEAEAGPVGLLAPPPPDEATRAAVEGARAARVARAAARAADAQAAAWSAMHFASLAEDERIVANQQAEAEAQRLREATEVVPSPVGLLAPPPPDEAARAAIEEARAARMARAAARAAAAEDARATRIARIAADQARIASAARRRLSRWDAAMKSIEEEKKRAVAAAEQAARAAAEAQAEAQAAEAAQQAAEAAQQGAASVAKRVAADQDDALTARVERFIRGQRIIHQFLSQQSVYNYRMATMAKLGTGKASAARIAELVDALCDALERPRPTAYGSWVVDVDATMAKFDELPVAQRMAALRGARQLGIGIVSGWSEVRKLISKIMGKTEQVWAAADVAVQELEHRLLDVIVKVDERGDYKLDFDLGDVTKETVGRLLSLDGAKVWRELYVEPTTEPVAAAGRHKLHEGALRVAFVFAHGVTDAWKAVWADRRKPMPDRITALEQYDAVVAMLQKTFSSPRLQLRALDGPITVITPGSDIQKAYDKVKAAAAAIAAPAIAAPAIAAATAAIAAPITPAAAARPTTAPPPLPSDPDGFERTLKAERSTDGYFLDDSALDEWIGLGFPKLYTSSLGNTTAEFVDALCTTVGQSDPPADSNALWLVQLAQVSGDFDGLPLTKRVYVWRLAEQLSLAVTGWTGTFPAFTWDTRLNTPERKDRMQDLLEIVTGKAGDVWRDARDALWRMAQTLYNMVRQVRLLGDDFTVQQLQEVITFTNVQAALDGAYSVWQAIFLSATPDAADAERRALLKQVLQVAFLFTHEAMDAWRRAEARQASSQQDKFIAAGESQDLMDLMDRAFTTFDAPPMGEFWSTHHTGQEL